MGFENECHPDPGVRGRHVIYTCNPCPGVRIALWRDHYNRVSFNLYCADRTTDGILTHKEDRAIANQSPVTCEDDPLLIQANICHLVNLYKATLPTEVTNEEA